MLALQKVLLLDPDHRQSPPVRIKRITPAGFLLLGS
jgi:hypothetical protein